MRSTKKSPYFLSRHQVFESYRLFHAKSSQQTFQFVTDIEGHLDYFKQQIRHSQVVKFIDSYESEITFINPSSDDLFVCGVDVCDRGDDITVTNMLLNLKEQFPDRVTLILGNRNGNKTRFIYELPPFPHHVFNDVVASVVKPAFASLSYKDYLTTQLMYREADLQACNTPINRLKWILSCTMAAP